MQKGNQYARDAHLKEQRTRTEFAREQQIMADVAYKQARTEEIAVDIELKKARTRLINRIAGDKQTAGVMLLGCETCGIYDVRDDGGDTCTQCGQKYETHRINLK